MKEIKENDYDVIYITSIDVIKHLESSLGFPVICDFSWWIRNPRPDVGIWCLMKVDDACETPSYMKNLNPLKECIEVKDSVTRVLNKFSLSCHYRIHNDNGIKYLFVPLSAERIISDKYIKEYAAVNISEIRVVDRDESMAMWELHCFNKKS